MQNIIFFHFKFFVSTLEGWKDRHFYGRPRAELSYATGQNLLLWIIILIRDTNQRPLEISVGLLFVFSSICI